MTRVLFAAHDSGLAGAENVLYRLMVSLKETDIIPVALFPDEGPGAVRCREAAIETRISPMTWWTSLGRPGHGRKQIAFLSGLDSRVRKVERMIEDDAIDTVFTNTAVIVEAALAALLTGRPHVWHIHEMMSRNKDVYALKDIGFLHALTRLVGGHVVAVSNAVRRDYAGAVPEEFLSVIPTGIDVSAFDTREGCDHTKGRRILSEGACGKRLLYVGNLSEAKGVPDLIRAMNKVWERDADVCLYLVGREVNVHRESLLENVSPSHRSKVVVLGFRNDMPEVLREADALVLPSHVDSFPLAVLEGMASALPVIGTRSGGMEDQIVDGTTGRLVPVGDSDALAEAILDVFSDPEKAKTMGRAGRRRVEEHYGIAGMAERFRGVFADAMKHPPVVKENACEHVRLFLKLGDVLGRQMTDCVQEVAEERNRYKASYDYFMSRPAVRWARAVKRFLRIGAGKSAEDTKGTSE